MVRKRAERSVPVLNAAKLAPLVVWLLSRCISRAPVVPEKHCAVLGVPICEDRLMNAQLPVSVSLELMPPSPPHELAGNS